MVHNKRAWTLLSVWLVLSFAPAAKSVYADEGHSEEERPGFNIGLLVRPFGIGTLTLLALTACAGLFRRKNPKRLLKWHKRLALATVAAALCHALLVLLFH